jgi:hypothetical protein
MRRFVSVVLPSSQPKGVFLVKGEEAWDECDEEDCWRETLK